MSTATVPLTTASLGAPSRSGPAAASLSERALATAFIAAAVLYLLTAFCAVVNFAWLQPIFDQFRWYDMYLSQPFPDNAIQAENGHRPIIPALLRLAEIHWFGANQKLQILVGSGLAFLTALTIAVVSWRSRELPLTTRAAGVFLAIIALLWLANARMLLHGGEAVQVYLVVYGLVAACLCCAKAGGDNERRWLLLAGLCCAVATFSFGSGIATFAAVFALAWLQRARLGSLLLVVGMMALSLFIYLYALPGDGGVRGQLEFEPVAVAATSSRWLASPWIVGWLGLNDTELYGWAQPSLRPQILPATLMAVADTLEQWTGLRWTRDGATVIGAAGIITFAMLALPYLRRRTRLTMLDTAALGLCLFTLATAVVVCLGRLKYLEEIPVQTFADRYLLWPCLFWLGLALLLLRRFAPRLKPAAQRLALLPLFAVAVIAWPTHELWNGWAATVYYNLQQSAASARSDALDIRHFAGNGAVTEEVTLRTLGYLRERKLAMYAEPGSDWLGRTVTGAIQTTGSIIAMPGTREALQDMRTGAPIARFDGWISSGISAAQDAGALVVLDPTNRIVGFADFSYIRPQARPLRLSLPKKRGYDGYIRDYDPGARYRLAIVRDPDQGGILLYEF